MRTPRLWVCSVVSLLIACGAFIIATYVDTDWNREPIQLPLPAAGVEVSSFFQISTPGSFHLRVETPAIAAEQNDAACNLLVVIASSSGRRIAMHVDHLRLAGSMGRIELWESQALRILRPGDYDISLSNRGATLFADRGAMVILEREYPPTETYLRMSLTRGLGWLALVVGVLTAVLAATMRRDAVPRAREDGDQSQ